MSKQVTARSQRAIARLISIEGSQANLAKRQRVSQGIVSKWLNGQTIITPKRAIAMEKAYPGYVSRADLRPDLWG